MNTSTRPPLAFSASYLAKLEHTDSERRRTSEATRVNHNNNTRYEWRRVRYEDGGRSHWGYYIEEPVRVHDQQRPQDNRSELEATLQPSEDWDNHAPSTSRSNHFQIDQLQSQSPVASYHHYHHIQEKTSTSIRAKEKMGSAVITNGNTLNTKTAGQFPKTYSWISLWFLVTVPVIAWDVSYCFMRPRSMRGGDLHWIWKPYEIYQEIDYIYGVEAYENGNGFTNAQSLMNVFETILNVIYLYLAHISLHPAANVVGFTSASLTLAKTVLYWAQEYYCNYCGVGHNTARDLLVYWVVPNGLWIVVPALIVRRLWKDLSASLNVAASVQRSVALDKRS